MLTDEELSGIEERNRERKDHRKDLPPGTWLYDSFAVIENSNDLDSAVRVKRDDRVFILIRRRPWINAIMKVCGDSILDEGTTARGDDKDLQPADVGLYVEKMMDGSAEKDIQKLMDEIRRLNRESLSRSPNSEFEK